MWRKLRRELINAVQYLLLPGLAALLPWPRGFRLLRRFAGWRWLYHDEWQAALASARQYVTIDDGEDWAWRYRLTRLVDHADYWLTRTRGDRWMDRHFSRRDAFPDSGAAVGVFFHWCAGLWGVRALRASGHRASVLAGHFSPASMGAWVAYFYGHLRLHELARCSGLPLLYSPGTVRRSVETLGRGDWIIGTPDVPPTETPLGRPAVLFGRPALFADGLMEIARRAGVPVVIFTCGLNLDDGRRDLRVSPPLDASDPQLRQRIVDYWEGLVREQPWAFTLWPAMPAFFHAGPAATAP